MKMAESSQNLLKTFWEKKKLLVKSNFFFSGSVFKRLVMQTRKNQGLCGKELNCLLVYKQISVGFCWQKLDDTKGENGE